MNSFPLGTIIILTPQIDHLARFYHGLLASSATLERDSEDHIGFRLVNGVYLGFDQVEQTYGDGGVSLWFDVPDMEAALAHGAAEGARWRQGPRHYPNGDILASFFDPEGRIVGLVQRGSGRQAADGV